ncbi:MAG: helix-turn-helix domain-containing protein [Bacillota bacterium]|nr:helix-turn-helix domain-containing protein [Bacillota bacterium]
MAQLELTQQQLDAAELLANGNSQAATARLVGVSSKSIQRWLQEEKFKCEVDRCVQELKNLADKKLTQKTSAVMDKLIAIALNGKSEKNSLDACIQVLNRVYGMPTSRIEQTTNNKDSIDNKGENKTDIKALLEDIGNNKVIPLDKAQ